MEDLGSLIHSLGLEYIRQLDGFILTQWGHATQILVDFGLENCNLKILPMIKNLHLTKDMGGFLVDAHFYWRMVGKLNFLLQFRPNIGFAVNNVNWFCTHLQKPHLDAVKHIYRYVKGTIDMGLFYWQGEDCVLSKFLDANWVGDRDDRISTTGYTFFLRSTPITWHSHK